MKPTNQRAFLLIPIIAIVILTVIAVFSSPARGEDPNGDLPPDRQTDIALEQQRRATGVYLNNQPGVPTARKRPSPSPFTPVPDVVETLVPGGAIDPGGGYVQFMQSGIEIQNSWWETTDDYVIRVYAGGYSQDLIDILKNEGISVRGDPSQGVVAEDVWTKDYQLTDKGKMFLTPTNNGSVRVIDAKGEILYLQADDGTNFTFDVSKGEFTQ
jgi:hypothetical protein